MGPWLLAGGLLSGPQCLSFSGSSFGGFDSGTFFLLGDAVERQLKPLEGRSVVCEVLFVTS
jgi:hypothetical protein